MNKKIIIALAGLLCIYEAAFAQIRYEEFAIRYKHKDSVCGSYFGKSFPGFNFKTTTGKTYTSKSTRGKVVFIHFWKVGCPPCRVQDDGLNRMYARLKNNPHVIFLSIVDENASTLREHLKDLNIRVDYPVVCLEKKLIGGYNFHWGFPTNVIIDKEGKIAFFKAGGFVEKLLAEDEVRNVFMKKIEELL